MADFQLKIVSPHGKVFEGKAESLVVPGENGSIGVLAHHAPMIAALQSGVLSVRPSSGSTQYFCIAAGLLEIDEGGVVVLTDDAFAGKTEAAAKEKLASLRA